jgi:RNA polymerase sigma-70 factor, ECF subfamily
MAFVPRIVRELPDEPEPGDWDGIFERYAPYVARVGLRLLGRNEELDDFVHDVFVEAMRSEHALRDNSARKAWLAGIAVNVARVRLRKRKMRARFFLATSIDFSDVANQGATPEERALLSRVYQTLETLPTEQSLAWSLRHLVGEPLDEVARLCGCSLATAKRYIAAAHAKVGEEDHG